MENIKIGYIGLGAAEKICWKISFWLRKNRLSLSAMFMKIAPGKERK